MSADPSVYDVLAAHVPSSDHAIIRVIANDIEQRVPVHMRMHAAVTLLACTMCRCSDAYHSLGAFMQHVVVSLLSHSDNYSSCGNMLGWTVVFSGVSDLGERVPRSVTELITLEDAMRVHAALPRIDIYFRTLVALYKEIDGAIERAVTGAAPTAKPLTADVDMAHQWRGGGTHLIE